MEQRTLNLDGTMVYVYADGSVEFVSKSRCHNGLHRTFGSVSGNGYMLVQINKKTYKVHRLVAMAFHENPNNYPLVDHIDRDKKNNKPENLRWASYKQNSNNTIQNDKSKERFGKRKAECSVEEYNKLIKEEYASKGLFRTKRKVNGRYVHMVLPLSEKKINK